MRFQFVAAEKAEYGVALVCRCLAVSAAGFYAWHVDHSVQRATRREWLRGRGASGRARPDADRRPAARVAGLFTTMNIALVEGRAFQATDDARGEPVVIINRTMAKRLWPHENPIDRRWLTGIGALIAVGGALAGGRFIAGLLFDTRATDPATLAGVVAATMVLALAAGIVLTRRAMSVEPTDA